MIKGYRLISAALICFVLLGLLPGPLGKPATASADAAEGGNIVLNPGFEDAALSPWEVKPGSPVKLEKDTTVKHSGSASVKFTPRDTDYGNFGQMVTLKRNVPYHFSAWVRLNADSASQRYIQLKLSYTISTDPTYKSGGTPYPMIARINEADTEWAHIEGTHTYTGALDEVSVWMYFETDYVSANVINVDDVYASEVKHPESIQIAGDASVAIPASGTAGTTYAATVFNQFGTTEDMDNETVGWSLLDEAAGVTVDGGGALTVDSSAAPGIYTVVATLNSNPQITAQKQVTVGGLAPSAGGVRIGGRPVVGEAVYGSYTYADPNGDPEDGTTYQWLRAGEEQGPYAEIVDAAGTTSAQLDVPYSLTGSDADQYLKLQIVPRNIGTPSVGEAVYSDPLFISAQNTAPTAANASIGGEFAPGQTLTGQYVYADANGDAEGASLYRWLESDSENGTYAPIADQTSAAWTISEADNGKWIAFEVTPVDAFGLSGTAVRSEPVLIDMDLRTEFYVDPASGDDANAGTESAPFRTIERARDEVRQVNGHMFNDITVYLRGGTYDYADRFTTRTIDDPDGSYPVNTGAFVLDETDSGTNGYDVVYKAYPGETPVISGGKAITDWTLSDPDKGIYRAYVGADLATRQLYVNGVRAIRARSDGPPANLTFNAATGHTTTDTGIASWGNLKDVEFVYQSAWVQHRIKVDSVTVNGGVATIAMNPARWQFAVNTGQPSITAAYQLKYIENAYELLDTDGEWYLDRTAGYLYYKPRTGENMADASVVVPVVDELLTMKGSSLTDRVDHIRVEGLSFQYAGWLRPEYIHGNHSNQNDTLRDAGTRLPESAVTVQTGSNIVFERNDFSHLGSTGLFMKQGLHDITIEGNRFTDISGSAVNVEDPTLVTPQMEAANPDLMLQQVDIDNNLIDTIGVEYESASAISAAHGQHMTISHNEIRNIPHTGIHIGWHHEVDSPVVMKDISIDHNHIFNLMSTGMYDSGAIYTLGRTAGSAEDPAYRITGNYIQNQLNASGVLYPDNFTNWWLAAGNVIDLKDSPPWQVFGTGDKFQDPLFLWIHDVQMSNNRIVDNYTTTGNYTNEGTNNMIEGVNVYPDAVWPSEAVDIIDQSGLEEAYRDLLPSGYYDKLLNPGFETRQTNVWRGDQATLQQTSSERHDGVYVGKVNRTAAEGTVKQTLTMQRGMTYGISAWIKLDAGAAAASIKLDFGPSADANARYATVATGTVDSEGWTELEGVYAYDGDEERAQPDVYVQLASGSGTAPYYVDDFHAIESSDVDQATLTAAIQDAQALYAAAAEGDEVGQYHAGAKADLQSAIDAALAVADEAGSTPQQNYRAMSVLGAKTLWFNRQQVRPTDFAALRDTVDRARQLADATEAGAEPGQYPAADRSALLDAIGAAQAVLDDGQASQAAVDAAADSLNAAIRGYENAVVIPDEELLADKIASAQQLHDAAQEGAGTGMVPPGSKASLQAAIDAAGAVLQGSESGVAATNAMIADIGNWTAAVPQLGDHIEIAGRGVGYKTKLPPNQMFEFNMEYAYTSGDWPSFAFRSKSPDVGSGAGATSYAVVFKEDVWELQKWVDGQREMLIGDFPGMTPRWGVLPNTQFTSGTKHKVRFGATNAENGVRLTMSVDDRVVFDEVDDTDPITDPGYLTVYSTMGPIKISPVNDLTKERLESAYADLRDAVQAFAGAAGLPEPASAAHSSLAADPSRVAADGAAAGTLTVTVRDAHDNPLQGHSVGLSQGGGSSTVTPVQAITDAAGHAVFTAKNAKAETVVYTATDETDGVTIAQTAEVVFAAPPSNGGGDTPPDDTPSDGTPPADTPPDDTPSDGTPPADTPPDGTPPDDTPPVDTPSDDTPPDDVPPADAPSDLSQHPVIDLNGMAFDPASVDAATPSLTLEVKPKDGIAYAAVPASVLTGLAGNNDDFFIEIKSPYGSYRVPAALGSAIPGLGDLLAANGLDEDDILFKIGLTDKTGDKELQDAIARNLPGGKTLGSAVDFGIDIVNAATGETIGKADRFNTLLTRLIPMPEELKDMPADWGAFRYDGKTGRLDFVPAVKLQMNGRWFAEIRSYTNSIYVAASHPVRFADMQSHWSEPYVELAAAKGLVEGSGGDRYEPNRTVTRAEFAAMLVRAVGRGKAADSRPLYDDVRPGAWYYDAIAEAKAMGLLDFADGKRLMPNKPLTREEMASMLAAAARLERLQPADSEAAPDDFGDIGSVSAAYLEDVRTITGLGIMNGISADTFSPQGVTTRAQAAVVLVRTLRTLGWTDAD